MRQFLLRLIRQLNDFLGPPFQQHAVLCEDNTVFAPVKKRHSQFLFQLHHLPGEGRLGNMEKTGSFGNVFFSCHHQKISENTDFHNIKYLLSSFSFYKNT